MDPHCVYQGNVGIKPPLPQFSHHFFSLEFHALPMLGEGAKGFIQQSPGARKCTLFVFYPCEALHGFLSFGQLQLLEPSVVAEGRGTVQGNRP